MPNVNFFCLQSMRIFKYKLSFSYNMEETTSTPISLKTRWNIITSMITEEDRKVLYITKYKKLFQKMKRKQSVPRTKICTICSNEFKNFGYTDPRIIGKFCEDCYKRIIHPNYPFEFLPEKEKQYITDVFEIHRLFKEEKKCSEEILIVT